MTTEALRGAYIVRLGKRRWAIEACFKVLKHPFGWDAFGQGTRLGLYRWWLLAFLSYLLTHWQFLASEQTILDWQQAAHQARKQVVPSRSLELLPP
ncbi:MAG: transposase [Leptolyngbya sp. SIO1D8]|nr:transposase [Leptolyngbya sp. SIO1D8]